MNYCPIYENGAANQLLPLLLFSLHWPCFRREVPSIKAEERDVSLIRVDSSDLADKRRLFEIFTALENYVDVDQSEEKQSQEAQKAALKAIYEVIMLCAKMDQKAAEKQKASEKTAIREQKAEEKAAETVLQLEELLRESPSLKREHRMEE